MNDRNTGVFIDAENLIGGYGASKKTFDMSSVMKAVNDQSASVPMKRILVARAYANWSKTGLGDLRRQLRGLGVETIHVEGAATNEKNASDIHLVVDLLGVAFENPRLDVVVLVSGDGGLTPLVRRLQLMGKYVIGVSREDAASALLKGVCDEFVELAPERPNPEPALGAPSVPVTQATWREAVVQEVETALAQTRFVALERIDASLRKQFGVRTLAEIQPESRPSQAISSALEQTSYVVFRNPDPNKTSLLVARREDVPSDAVTCRPAGSVDLELEPAAQPVPAFRGGGHLRSVAPVELDQADAIEDPSGPTLFRGSPVARTPVPEYESNDN